MLCSLGMVPEPTLRFYFAEALCGLRYLHQEGVLHHDIKPQNMLIAANGHLKLADFGLSSGLSNNVGHGTLPYIAPEVLRRRRDRLHGKRPSNEPVTAPMAAAPTVATPHDGHGGSNAGDAVAFALDMWSYGVVFFELLSGERPFRAKRGDTVADMLSTIEQSMTGDDDGGDGGDGGGGGDGSGGGGSGSGGAAGGVWRPSHQAKDLCVSPASVELSVALLRMDPSRRLTCAGVQSHPFFEGVDWEHLADQSPPFVPELHGPDDTHYFGDNDGYDHEGALSLSDEEQDVPGSSCSPIGSSQGDESDESFTESTESSFKGAVNKDHLIRLSLQRSSSKSLDTHLS